MDQIHGVYVLSSKINKQFIASEVLSLFSFVPFKMVVFGIIRLQTYPFRNRHFLYLPFSDISFIKFPLSEVFLLRVPFKIPFQFSPF